LHELTVDGPRITTLAERALVDTICVWAPGSERNHFRTRDLCAAIGAIEEPASGTTSGALALYLAQHDQLADSELVLEQGVEMGRPSRIELAVTPPDLVTVRGQARKVLEGRLELPRAAGSMSGLIAGVGLATRPSPSDCHSTICRVAATKLTGKTATEIAESLELAIDRGEIRPGDRLPTVRGLAKELGVSPVTVAMAYRTLQQRGFVVGDGRRGTRVRAGTGRPYLSVTSVPEGVRNLALGNPDPELVPRLARGLRALDPIPFLYGGPAHPPPPVAPVRRQVRADGIACDRLAVVSGALDGIERVLVASCRPGDRVIVEDPCFPRVLDLVRALGLELVPVQVDDRGPRPDSLEQALKASARAALFTPRAHNPTGGYIDPDRSRQLRRLLEGAPGLLVIEDDYAGPIAGAPLRTLTAKRDRWVHVRSFSKVLGPDLRIAFVAGDEATLARVEVRQRLG